MQSVVIPAGQIRNVEVELVNPNDSVEVLGQLVTPPDIPAILTQSTDNMVDVGVTGLVQSDGTAVQIEGIDTVVSNFGVIDGGFNGINVANGGVASARIINQNTGLITSESRAVNLGGLTNTLINNGRIETTASPRNGTVYGDVTAPNIFIRNNSSGVIDVGEGNDGDAISLELGETVSGSVDNRGVIQGRGLPGAVNPDNQASAVRFYNAPSVETSTFNGDLSNRGRLLAENGPAVIVETDVVFNGDIDNRGLIQSAHPGNGVGILLEDGSEFNGTIRNRGVIDGGRDGINFANGGNTSGTVRNQRNGVITSTSRAINIGGDGIDIFNDGLITTSADPRNGTIYADQTATNYTINNGRRGIIDVGLGNNGDAISLQLGSEVSGEVVNRGLIQGRGVDDGDPDNATNQATAVRLYRGSEAGDVAVFEGDIRNLSSGTLASETDDAILIEEGVELQGNIVNRGTILAGEDGIDIDGALVGNIDNRGTINAGDEGIHIDGSVLGNISNRGNITADRDGLDIDGTVTGNIENRGNISTLSDGAVEGIDVDGDGIVNGDIINRGTVSASGEGIEISSNATLNGDINNFGGIIAAENGIDIDGTFNGVLNNFGTIQGNLGFEFDSEPSFAIDGAGADAGLTVNNAGVLNSDVVLSNFDDVFDSSQGVVNGNDDSEDGTIFGLDGDDILIGGRDRDVLSGGAGDDTLTGGLGVDTFVYAPDALGADVITDFTDGEDLLDVSAFSFGAADLQAVIGGAQQIGAATLLTFAPDNTALLQDVQVAQIDAADFIA
ncbi:MAG: hypothetical protein AAGB13_03020 [Cyanobacteria bacterium P01_F01_bin.33]